MGLTLKPSSPPLVQDAPLALGVLVVDEELPYPLTSGKRIRTFNLIKQLASRHHITFLCHRNADATELRDAVQQFENLGIEIVFLERKLPKPTVLTSKPQLFAQLAYNFLSDYPYLVQKHLSSELLRKLKHHANREDIDLVHFEWTPYAVAMADGFTKPWIVDAHNVESLIWKRYFQTEANKAKRWYIGQQWKKLDRFESRIFQSASRTIFVSDADRLIAKSEFGCLRQAVVENGVDTTQFQFKDSAARSPGKLLFLGSLDWRPNVDGIEFFLDVIWPLIQQKNTEVQLDIVGRRPPTWFSKRVHQEPNVSLYADVTSVQPYLERASLMVVPLRIGGGSRLKILEAAAVGLPVVSTSVGAEGLELKSGIHYVNANQPQEFADAIVTLANNPDTATDMIHSIRQLVEQRYDWGILSRKVDAIWRSAVNVKQHAD